MSGVLLCTDMDRTVLPNGTAEESPAARPLFRAVAARPEVTLAYVTGRDQQLIRDGIAEYGIPVPDFAIGDVGTTIYDISGGQWRVWPAWFDEIAPDWRGMQREELAALFADMSELRLQEDSKQNLYKLSYYTAVDADADVLIEQMRERLEAHGVRASFIASVDEQAGVGLLDVLPERANKVHAIRFLMQSKGFTEAETVFAGDSGNDLAALTSGLQAVLVRNAADEVREEAVRLVEERGVRDRLYLARGSFLGLNGNYAAGILEGLAHFLPHTAAWMQATNDSRR